MTSRANNFGTRGREAAQAAGRLGGKACPNASRTFARSPAAARNAGLLAGQRRRQRAAASAAVAAPTDD